MHVCTWIKEEVAVHLKTYHCSRGSVVPPVFCSLCPTLLRAGTSVSVEEHKLKHLFKSLFSHYICDNFINFFHLLIHSYSFYTIQLSYITKLTMFHAYVQYHLNSRNSRLRLCGLFAQLCLLQQQFVVGLL